MKSNALTMSNSNKAPPTARIKYKIFIKSGLLPISSDPQLGIIHSAHASVISCFS